MAQSTKEVWQCDVCGYCWLKEDIIPSRCVNRKCRSMKWNASSVSQSDNALLAESNSSVINAVLEVNEVVKPTENLIDFSTGLEQLSKELKLSGVTENLPKKGKLTIIQKGVEDNKDNKNNKDNKKRR